MVRDFTYDLFEEPRLFQSDVLAGFECGHLGWNGHDLLNTTGHVPHQRMLEHLGSVRQLGLRTVRDGLPWRHDPETRIEAARRADVEAIWDLNHYDPPPDATAHAARCALAADASRPFWICPVNEPMMYPMLAGMSWEAATDLALHMVRVAKDHHPEVRVLSTDPIVGIGDLQFAATDRLVAAGVVDVVGVNYYPHTARTSLSKALVKTWRRYCKPVLLAETSWHDGHRGQRRRFPGFDKGRWLRHVQSEIAVARAKGAQVVGLCWYPIVDCPPWNRPRSSERWSHGLIRANGSLDPTLAAALA